MDSRCRISLWNGLLLAGLAAGCALARPTEPTPTQEGERPLQVGFLVRDGVYNTELTAPVDIFQHTIFHTQPGMEVFLVSPDGEEVRTFEGLRLRPDYSIAEAPPIDVLVVPSCEHSMDSDLDDTEMIAWVRRTGASARYVLSLCDGAFVLAQAGLLDGRKATTFPSDIERLRERFPAVDVLRGPSFVHDGTCITSVGGMPSFYAALYLCELLYGAEAARGIAGGLVIDWDLAAIPHVTVPSRF